MKIIKRLIQILIIIIILAVVLVWLGINPIAKSAVQSGASDTLGVKTTLASINVSPLRGRVLMNDLNISNPEGFLSVSLMNAGRFEIEVAPASLLSDTVEIRKFEIDGLEMNIEQKLPFSNIAKIIDNIKRSSADKPKDDAEAKKVTADLVLIKDITAHFKLLPGASEAGTVTVKVPQIELRNVSSERAGSVTGQLVSQLFPALLSSILSEAQGVVPTDFLKDLESQVLGLAQSLGKETSKLVKPIGDGLRKTVEETGLDEPLEDAGKTLEKGAKDVMEGIFGTQRKTQESE